MPRRRVRDHTWTAPERAVLIAVVAIVMGSLFLTTYTLALGDPVPRHIDAALVGDPARHARTVEAVQQIADGTLAFQRYHRGSFDLRLALRFWAAAPQLSRNPPVNVSVKPSPSGKTQKSPVPRSCAYAPVPPTTAKGPASSQSEGV
jgi:hypothetical protein